MFLYSICFLFTVPEFDRIGVNITAQRYGENKANKELIEYLAEVLGLSKCDIKLVSVSIYSIVFTIKEYCVLKE